MTLDLLFDLPPEERIRLLIAEGPHAWEAIEAERGTKWAAFADWPEGFVEIALGEFLWSKQRDILRSLVDNKRTVVPACHAPGKSHIAARAVAWWGAVHPPGTALVITTAPTFRQVRTILWPHIRRVHAMNGLLGEMTTTEWKVGRDLVAFGFSPSDHDESAVQGIHVPHLLIIVDEAGGISPTLGRSFESLMTGGHTRLLAIGNPPSDDSDTWFERAVESGNYEIIRIAASDTPNFTGEECPPEVARQLIDSEWVDDVVREFGKDSSYVEARVHARFPRDSGNRVIPIDWIEQAMENEDPSASDQIRLGVDVAAGGGDEVAVARAEGFTVRLVYSQGGSANLNAVDVAGQVLRQIEAAERLAATGPWLKPVRVKIDSVGVGWGVSSILETWKSERRHSAEIVRVNVGERSGSPQQFANQRAEMWWNARTLLQPDSGGRQEIKLDIDRKTAAQLSVPRYGSDSSGRIAIEKKEAMRKRGVPSPDRAEAILLALYETPRGRVPVVGPTGIEQANPWQIDGN